jgi:hypothetical protein
VIPSTPYLRVISDENEPESTRVEFWAGDRTGADARRRLVFFDGAWVRFSPGYADAEVVEDSAYDWSAIYRHLTATEPFREVWLRSHVCPNPRAYEVADSPWLAELGRAKMDMAPYRHFLILGHDAYVEVVAQDWREELVAPGRGDDAP